MNPSKEISTPILLAIIVLVVLIAGLALYFYNRNNAKILQSKYAIFNKNYDISYEIGEHERYTPSQEDVQKSIELINSFLGDKKDIVDDLSVYKVQFFGYIDENGHKNIWANYFCDNSPGWKKEAVLVDDGGNCYFSMRVNLDTGNVFDFWVNGEA